MFSKLTKQIPKSLRLTRLNIRKPNNKLLIGSALTLGGLTSTLMTCTLCEYKASVTGNSAGNYSAFRPFMLLDALIQLAPIIDHRKLLKEFKQAINSKKKVTIDEKFVQELFKHCGITDEDIASAVFQVMDWNGNGKLDPVELAATFTLFNVGNLKERYTFLFHCIDLDDSDTVDKSEFRLFLSSLLETQFRLKGLNEKVDEEFTNIIPSEYRTVAKLQANVLVRDIFNYADKNRDGELSLKEFLSWCRRGGKAVDTVKDLLATIVEERKHDFGMKSKQH